MANVNPLTLTIRAKKLGVLIRDARQGAGKTVEECSRAIGVPVEAFEAYELGDQSPSLPELEALAFFLKTPLDHFWGDRVASEDRQAHLKVDLERLVALRQRMIGALLRQARLDAGLSIEELAELSLSAPALIESYELGEQPVPMPELEAITSVLNRPVKEFFDQRGPVGAWSNQQRVVQEFMALSPELQAFVAKPINRPYLELAMRLSEMDVKKLRAVAEGLLEITF